MKKITLDTLKAKEFKQLIEQKTPDGMVNTLPELMELLQEIPDGMSLSEYITKAAEQSAIDEDTLRRIVSEAIRSVIDNKEAGYADIDEIFPEFMDDSDSSGSDSSDSQEPADDSSEDAGDSSDETQDDSSDSDSSEEQDDSSSVTEEAAMGAGTDEQGD